MSDPNVSVTVYETDGDGYTVYEGSLSEVSEEIASNEDYGYYIGEVEETT